MTSISIKHDSQAEGLRPVNLRTDLAALADLIELVFADSMDQSGRAAVREMRYLSKVGAGLSIFPGLNELTQGINMGFVWIASGRLVGNVSIYPAGSPHHNTWIIANVGVHPDYQRRGIATRLMHAGMDLIRQRGGQRAILQVDMQNDVARRMYENLGFTVERGWITWRRSGSVRIPTPLDDQPAVISHLRRGEWRAEYELARQVRPAERGGLGWQRPLHPDLFRKSLLKRLTDWLNVRFEERLVIRSDDERRLLASVWVESGFMTTATRLTLMVAPDYQGSYDELLLNNVVRRLGGRRTALTIEHPADETLTGEVLRRYHFRPQREVIHMRWDVR